MTSRKGVLVLALLSAIGVAAPGARADDTGADEAALALFGEGRRLMAAGDFADACPKFAESRRLAPGVGTTLNLALCYEGLGKTASAWSLYLEAAAVAREKGQTERATGAQTRATRLEPDLLRATIAIAPQSDARSITVRLDGRPLTNETLGSPAPIDPGRHEIEAAAPGKQSWISTFDITDQRQSSVVVPVLAPLAPAAKPSSDIALVAPVTHETQRAPAGENNLKTAGIILAATGATTVAVGIAFALAANSENESAQLWCVAAGCLSQAQPALSRALTDADIASVTISLGIAAVVGGGILWFVAPTSSLGNRGAKAGALRVLPSVGIDRWSLTATGAF